MTDTSKKAFDIIVWDNEEIRHDDDPTGKYVLAEDSLDIERERNAHFEVLRQVADLFGITDWDSTTLVQQLRVWKNEIEGMG